MEQEEFLQQYVLNRANCVQDLKRDNNKYPRTGEVLVHEARGAWDQIKEYLTKELEQ